MEYLRLLHEELADAKDRLKRCGKEGRRIVNRQIKEIERDIWRYSMKMEDGNPQKGKSC